MVADSPSPSSSPPEGRGDRSSHAGGVNPSPPVESLWVERLGGEGRVRGTGLGSLNDCGQVASPQTQSVTAPTEAEATTLAYLANMRRVDQTNRLNLKYGLP